MDTSNLIDAIKADLQTWYDQLQAALRPQVDQAIVNLAHYTALLATDPDNAQHRQSIQHVLGTLKNSQAHAAVEAHRMVQRSVYTVLSRVALSILAAV